MIQGIEKFLIDRKIRKQEVKLNLEYLKNIASELNIKCGMTHQEIANEFGVNRIKITRLINKKWTKRTSPCSQHLLGHTKIDTTLHYAFVNQNNIKISHRKYIC